MTEWPASLKADHGFPHKAEAIAALNEGASLRRDSRILLANELWGTYQIRLNIARDFTEKAGKDPEESEQVADLELLVANLRREAEGEVIVWYVRVEDGRRFWLFENRSGAPLGCLYGRVPKSEDQR